MSRSASAWRRYRWRKVLIQRISGCRDRSGPNFIPNDGFRELRGHERGIHGTSDGHVIIVAPIAKRTVDTLQPIGHVFARWTRTRRAAAGHRALACIRSRFDGDYATGDRKNGRERAGYCDEQQQRAPGSQPPWRPYPILAVAGQHGSNGRRSKGKETPVEPVRPAQYRR